MAVTALTEEGREVFAEVHARCIAAGDPLGRANLLALEAALDFDFQAANPDEPGSGIR